MSYKLNKTDGSLLVDLVDGKLDTTTTDISLKTIQDSAKALTKTLLRF